MPPTEALRHAAAPWAAAGQSPEDAQRLLQEKLARAKAMKADLVIGGKTINTTMPDPAAAGRPSTATPFAQRSSDQSPSHVVISSRDEDDDWAMAARAEQEAARQEAILSHEVLGRVTVENKEAAGHTIEFAVVKPYKAIRTTQDLERFKAGTTYALIKDFVLALNQSCKGKKIRDESRVVSPACQKVVGLVRTMSSWIDEIPPIQQPMRYGNKAFRDWALKAETSLPALVTQMLEEGGGDLSVAAAEAWPYLAASLGDKTRIDYGTGHECMFVCFLLVLARLNFFTASDSEALALEVFAEYVALVRRLQVTYRLEPAGSHGCWSLDDYHFLPFLWGSSQLVGDDVALPRSIHDDALVTLLSPDFFYFHCVQFIRQVKSGSLAENSPMLNDISSVASWQRVNNGMAKMFFAEVMDKLPVMQHMLFGSILPPP